MCLKSVGGGFVVLVISDMANEMEIIIGAGFVYPALSVPAPPWQDG